MRKLFLGIIIAALIIVIGFVGLLTYSFLLYFGILSQIESTIYEYGNITYEYIIDVPSYIADIPYMISALFEPEPGAIPASIAKANNEFAIDFYKQISNDTDNHFFSSLSMYTAFSILYEGARGNTADELAETFGFETDDTIRHNDTAHMISSINRNDRHATLTMANALWIAKWFSLYDSYSGIAHDTYKSTAKTVDFTDPKDSVDRINKWAADNTNNKIKKVVTPNDVNDLTAMVINNAIYFKGTWLTQFLPEDTKESDFWLSETNNVQTDFMNMKDYFNYTKSDGAQVLKMPYEGDRLSMLVILPDERPSTL